MAVCAPMRTLWPIWIWLSRRTSSSSTVSSIAPRSMVVLAPISQSSPITTPPSCGTLSQRPASIARPKPSAPSTAPGCTRTRWPKPHAGHQRDARDQFAAGADHAIVADDAARADHGACLDAAARADTDERADVRGRVDVRAGVDTALAMDARPGAAACGSNSAAILREGRVRIAGDQARCRRVRRRPPRASPRRRRRVSASWLRYVRIGEEGQLPGAGAGQRADALRRARRRSPREFQAEARRRVPAAL